MMNGIKKCDIVKSNQFPLIRILISYSIINNKFNAAVFEIIIEICY